MSDPALPRIKVTDAQNLEGGASPVDTPSTTTDGGQSARPRSATSSEGISLLELFISGDFASQIASTRLAEIIR
jgi:hypothetical protein